VRIFRALAIIAACALAPGPAADSALASNTAAVSVYRNATTSEQWATTGQAPAGYTLQSTLGLLAPSPTPGASPLYDCLNSGSDRFLSLNGGCEGRTQLDVEGYLFGSAPSSQAATPLYRCSVPGGYHFASTSPACGGQINNGPLGYMLASAPLQSYRNQGGSDYWVTTGPDPSGYSLEASLGYLLDSSGSGRVALYGCLFNGGHFLSISGCEGQTVLGVEGFLYGRRRPEWRRCPCIAATAASTTPPTAISGASQSPRMYLLDKS